MRRASFLSIALLGGLVALGTSCGSDPAPVTTASGGSDTGGSGQTGGSANQSGGSANQTGGTANQTGGTANQTGGTANQTGGTPNQSGGTANLTGGTTGDSGGTANQTGGTANLTGGTTGTGGGAQVGTTDPAASIAAMPLNGGYYTMDATYHGYCYTYGDTATTTVRNPPCGTAGPCFTSTTGLCAAGTTSANSATVSWANWGIGIGCSLNQDLAVDGGTTTANPASIAGKTTINITVYGNTMPTTNFQVGVTVTNPPVGDAGTAINGTFCYGTALTSGTHISIPLTSLTSACWSAGGAALDPATMTISNLQIQVSAGSAAMPYDLCISEFTIT